MKKGSDFNQFKTSVQICKFPNAPDMVLQGKILKTACTPSPSLKIYRIYEYVIIFYVTYLTAGHKMSPSLR